MAKYRKKPVVIEAFQLGVDSLPVWFIQAIKNGSIVVDSGAGQNILECEITTLEGVMTGNYGDFIIQGVNQEIYPCKVGIFAKTYELVNENEEEETKRPQNK